MISGPRQTRFKKITRIFLSHSSGFVEQSSNLLKAADRADGPPLTQISTLAAVIEPMIRKFRIALTTCGAALLMTAAITVKVDSATRISSTQENEPKRLSAQESERIIAGRAKSVIQSLKAGNIAKFSTFVHPQKGVRFSPYASVLPDEDRLVKKNQLQQMWASRKRYKWGGYDGSGDPIWLTFKKYHRRFIFDHDFSRAKNVAYNPDTMSHGNTPNTILEYYPKSIAVEYHFPGFDTKFSGMDWSSLWLVFEKKGSDWYLVGIVHDEWTI